MTIFRLLIAFILLSRRVEAPCFSTLFFIIDNRLLLNLHKYLAIKLNCLNLIQIEHLSLELLNYQPPMLCGLLHLDRRLVYLIAVTAFSYFITLVQFDLYLRKKS